MHKFKTNYSSFTNRNSENICSKKEERQGETKFTTKIEMPPPLNANVVFFLGILLYL
jgi:hypothetical protein